MINPALDRFIAADPGVRAGQPCLAGSRLTVADVVILHLRLGRPFEDISATYDVPLAAVYAAMAFYHDHRDEIDRRIADDQDFAEAFERNNPSPLQARLRALSDG